MSEPINLPVHDLWRPALRWEEGELVKHAISPNITQLSQENLLTIQVDYDTIKNGQFQSVSIGDAFKIRKES